MNVVFALTSLGLLSEVSQVHAGKALYLLQLLSHISKQEQGLTLALSAVVKGDSFIADKLSVLLKHFKGEYVSSSDLSHRLSVLV